MQEIEGRRRLALEIVADDVGPDQVIGAQHVEGVGHPRAFKNALLLHVLFERRDLLLVDVDHQVAAIGEVDLRREQRRRGDTLTAVGGEPRQRRRQQRTADAVADRVDLHLAGDALDDIHRRERSLLHVVGKRLLTEGAIGIDPGDDEHRQPLIDAPFDEGFFRAEIEDVELVDPRRHDQERRPQHVLGGRLVLDQLDQLVLEDHLARRDRHVAANFEIGR